MGSIKYRVHGHYGNLADQGSDDLVRALINADVRTRQIMYGDHEVWERGDNKPDRLLVTFKFTPEEPSMPELHIPMHEFLDMLGVVKGLYL